MATVNKDFKIKHGLIVEGAEGTINGNVILTETAGDAYILDLIGGETLVTSVNPDQLEVVSGELSVKSGVFDADGAAASAQTAANAYTDGEITTALTTAQGYADTAESNAEAYADSLAPNYDPAGSASAAQTAAQSYADGLAVNYDAAGAASTAESNAATYTDNAISGLGGSGTASVAGNIDVLTGTGIQVNGGNNSVEIDRQTVDTWYDASGSADAAQQAAELYADNAIAALVDSAPATLDTLNELAAALQDNPDIIGDLQTIAAGKQDTLTAGANIDITGATISVTGLDTDDVAEGTNLYFTNQRALDATASAYDTTGTAQSIVDALDTDDIEEGVNNLYFTNQRALDATNSAYDAAGAASDAQTAAETFATNAINALDTDDIEEGVSNLYFSDVRAKTSAAALITGATKTNIVITGDENGLTITAENGVADSNTDDLAEGEENLYFTDERAIDAVSAADIYPNAVIINNLTKQVANQTTVATAGIATGISWAKADYRSAEFVVKVAYGDHTEISKVLMTLDVNDNIAITEYGNVTTNGSASSISADISGTDARLRVTTVNNNSTVTVLGTLIA